jgi:hypothetical protein
VEGVLDSGGARWHQQFLHMSTELAFGSDLQVRLGLARGCPDNAECVLGTSHVSIHVAVVDYETYLRNYHFLS